MTNFYKENGYLKIESAFSLNDLEPIVEELPRLLAMGKATGDTLVENGIPKKILYMFDKSNNFLKLLVSLPIINLLRDYCDDVTQVVPTWEDMIVKLPFTKTGFKPHQDLPLQSINSHVFTVAIYLTSSVGAPVYFLPSSHYLGPLTRGQLAKVWEKEKNNFVAIPANRGDVIMHNSQIIHYSSDNNTDISRYTWYIEFRTVSQLREDSLWDEAWISQRRAIFLYALQKYQPDMINELAPDFDCYKTYLENIKLKVPHVTSTVNYDMSSPYYHF